MTRILLDFMTNQCYFEIICILLLAFINIFIFYFNLKVIFIVPMSFCKHFYIALIYFILNIIYIIFNIIYYFSELALEHL